MKKPEWCPDKPTVIKDSEAIQYVGKATELRGKEVSVTIGPLGKAFIKFGGQYPDQTFAGLTRRRKRFFAQPIVGRSNRMPSSDAGAPRSIRRRLRQVRRYDQSGSPNTLCKPKEALIWAFSVSQQAKDFDMNMKLRPGEPLAGPWRVTLDP
jgi:hypothetical protein